MPQDFAAAEWRPSPNFWAGYDKRDFIVVHATASGDGATEYVPDFSAATGKSTHYAIAMDGHVVQYVSEANSAWGNCCTSGNSSFVAAGSYNWNRSTISIENEKHSSDNSTSLTVPQYQSLLTLVRDIARRWNIPLQHGRYGLRGVIFHHDLDPINKGLCPGTFPYDSFFADLSANVPPALPALSRDAVVKLVQAAGFSGTHPTLGIPNVDLAVAIAQAESSFFPHAYHLVVDVPQTDPAYGSVDRGIFQINSYWHKEVSDTCAYDPPCAAKETFRITKGYDFSTWTTFKNGRYKLFLPTSPGVTVKHNDLGMVLDIAQSFQLENGESGDLCGMWAVGSLKYANIPGGGIAPGTDEKIDQWADAEADKYGSHLTWPGSSIPDMENFFKDAGNLHYWEITPSIDRITRAVQAGYPVIITAYEPNIFSWDGSSWVHAYPWSIDANHILPVVGIDNIGNFICADQLNASYQGRWPVIYDASRLSPSWAAVVQVVGPDPAHPWLATIPNGDPLTWPPNFNAQLFAGGTTSMPVPQGWKDDGKTLTSPNGHHAVLGFRNHIINNPWDSGDWLLEEEQELASVEESNPSLGKGAAQTTRMHRLEYTAGNNSIFLGWLGQEYLTVKADRDAKAKALGDASSELTTANAKLSAANAQIADLEAKLAAAQQPTPPANLADLKADLQAASSSLSQAGNYLSSALKAIPS